LNDNNFVSETIGTKRRTERAEKLMSGSGAVSVTFEKGEEQERSAEREIGEWERSGERKSKTLVERGAAF
jgi:4-diphosphocytidyl-2C-methyl-D-erythritol kinase